MQILYTTAMQRTQKNIHNVTESWDVQQDHIMLNCQSFRTI